MEAGVIRHCPDAAVWNRINPLVADALALFLKVKMCRWKLCGAGASAHHALLEDLEAELLAMADALAERVRVARARTVCSLEHMMDLQSVADRDDEGLSVQDMLANLAAATRSLAAHTLAVQWFCEEYDDRATSALLGAILVAAESRSASLIRAAAASGAETRVATR